MNEKEYKDKKSYHDYQRVVQYNREIIQLALKDEHKDMFNHVWGCLPSENYETPPGDLPIKNIGYLKIILELLLFLQKKL